jgi:uncharacterized protein YyaL (SSP411 family)
MNEWLSDQERGGFYASQDADISLDDDGDYFTWTREEAEAVLTPEEMAIAGPYYDIGELGDMHHNPKKNVLHRRYSVEEIAQQTGRSGAEVAHEIQHARAKLYMARMARTTPFVDKTVYTGWNAMAVSAYLDAARVLDLEAPRMFALRTLDRILREGWEARRGLLHVIAYAEQTGATKPVAGVLDDYALTANACVDAWQATGEMRYYEAAMAIAGAMVERFHDAGGGGFFDTEKDAGDKLGALTARRKPTQDAPTPAGNSTAAAALLRLEALSGRKDFREKAEGTLAAFAGLIEHYGLYAGSYALALERLLLPPVQVTIVGEGTVARQLAAVAQARFAVNKSVVRLGAAQVEHLPPVLAETLPHLPGAGEGPVALVCRGTSCMPPAGSAEELIEQINAEV